MNGSKKERMRPKSMVLDDGGDEAQVKKKTTDINRSKDEGPRKTSNPWKMPANTDSHLYTKLQGDVLIKVNVFQQKLYVDLRKVFGPESGEGVIYTQKGITLTV